MAVRTAIARTNSSLGLPVSRALQDHFGCTWVHQLPVDGTSSIVIVPDGSIDLQWVAGGWRIAGPDREPQTEMLPAGAIIIGFRFRPAAAAAWLGLPATEVLNQRVALDDIWGVRARRMAEEVRPAREPEALMAALENAVAAAKRAAPAWRAAEPQLRAAALLANDETSGLAAAIVTENDATAAEFLGAYAGTGAFWNASTRFNDGEEFGFGAEIGISTDKLHARGPMALPELTTYKYLVRGAGQLLG